MGRDRARCALPTQARGRRTTQTDDRNVSSCNPHRSPRSKDCAQGGRGWLIDSPQDWSRPRWRADVGVAACRRLAKLSVLAEAQRPFNTPPEVHRGEPGDMTMVARVRSRARSPPTVPAIIRSPDEPGESLRVSFLLLAALVGVVAPREGGLWTSWYDYPGRSSHWAAGRNAPPHEAKNT